MTQVLCYRVCLDVNARWYLEDFANGRHQPQLVWTSEANQALRLACRKEAIALAQIAQRFHSAVKIRVLESDGSWQR